MVASRYLISSVVPGILVSLLALVALGSAIEFVGEIKEVGRGGYTMTQAAAYALLGLAPGAYVFFPVAVLIGAAVSLNGLGDRLELLALRTLGYSRRGLGWVLAAFGVVLMALAFVFGETVLPEASAKAQEIKHGTPQQNMVYETAGGYWTRLASRYVFFKRAPGGVPGALEGVDAKVYELGDGHRLNRILYAGRIALKPHHLLLEDVTIVQWHDDGLQTVQQQPRYEIPEAGLADGLVSSRALPDTMNLLQLHRHIQFLRQNLLDDRRYDLAFWTRFSTVLVIPVMLLLALPSAFASTRSSQLRLHEFIAILIGVAYLLFSRVIANVSIAGGLPPFVGAFLPLILLSLIAVLFFRQKMRA